MVKKTRLVLNTFKTFSNLPIPQGLEKPDKPLSYYLQLEFPHAPGIRPQW